jgi:hypothetical protein
VKINPEEKTKPPKIEGGPSSAGLVLLRVAEAAGEANLAWKY